MATLVAASMLFADIERTEAYAGPGSGLFPFGATSGPGLSSPHSSGLNPLIPWATLEPQDNVYNWAPVDSAIASARSAGRRVILRVYTNWGDFAQGTPNWYFGLPGALSYYPSTSAQSKGFEAPVSWDPVFKQKFGEFLTAFGQRYNGNSTIEFVQTNAGGGLYGEMLLGSGGRVPPGYSNSVFLSSINYWTDRWAAAFPSTKQAIMVNYLGGNLGESASAYAAGKGVYLQQNSPNLSAGSVALFTANASKTKIIIDADDACLAATGQAFDALVTKLFGFGTPLDYILFCYKSFSDPATAAKLPNVLSRLRGASAPTGGSTPAPTPTPGSGTEDLTSNDYRTDFSGTTIPAGWTWVNPVGNATLSFTANAGHARISNPSGQAHDCWWNTNCSRLMHAVANTDHTFETKIDGINLNAATQSYGILLWQDSTHFIRFEFWTDGKGVRPAAWTVNGSSKAQAIMGPVISMGSSNSLRVTRIGNKFTLQYSTNGGGTWQTAGSFTQTITVAQAGVHVINSPTPSTTASFDYFQIQ